MADKIFLYDDDEDSEESRQRRLAVEAALELIKAEALGGGERAVSIQPHLEHLAEYADRIQAALKVK